MEKPLNEWPVQWQTYGWNNCFAVAVEALKFLANHERPIGGEQHFNSMHLEDIAHSIDRTLKAMANEKARTAALSKLTEDDKKVLGLV